MTTIESCLREIPRPIPPWNLALLREKYPEHRPPLPYQTIAAWPLSSQLPPCLYEYLTEFSDTIYTSNGYNQTKIQSAIDEFLCLDNTNIYFPISLNLTTGEVVGHYYNDEQDEPGYERRVAASFEEYIMEQFRAPIPDCNCPKCKRGYVSNYTILRIMSGMKGVPI